MATDDANQVNKTMIKVVYFDEESASDYLDISAGGKEVSTSEKVKERSKETYANVETSLIAKLSWLPFLGASADASAGAGLSAAGRSILSKTLSNTILTDYLAKSGDDKNIRQLRGFRVTAPKDSMAYMKMYTPYMIILKSDELPIDLSRFDEALGGAKGYYELIGEDVESSSKYILRFNIRAFRNNYGLADLGRMNLVFHGVLVGKAAEDGLGMASEMSQGSSNESLSAADILDNTSSIESALLDVYDVILAGVEHER
jgi:Family of unknown function (DUF6414)